MTIRGMTAIEPRDYSIADMATLSDQSVYTIRRRIAAGEIPAYRVGPRAIRIRREDGDRYLDGRRIPAARMDA